MPESPLLTEADALARLTDSLSKDFARELATVLRDLERELRRLAFEAQQGKQGALARAVRAARVRRQIAKALRAAGYEALAERATTRSLDRVVVSVERLRLAAQLVAFTTADSARIVALQELAKRDLLGLGDQIAHAVWRTFAYGLLTQRPLPDLIEDLADSADVELSRARTWYDTTVNVFSRQVEALKGQPDDVYVYLGPADVKLRPFCRARVGKVYDRPAIDAMDNGQIPNVFLTGGGYNCRHSWIAVSRLSGLRDLVGTDQRMPEVEAQLARVGKGQAA